MTTVLCGFAPFLGAAVGSFLNVCIWRIPREGMGINNPPRSRCPRCGFEIPWYDNLPVLSWFLLRGRCRGCRTPISMRYLVVELLAAFLFFASACLFLQDGSFGLWAAYAILGSLLIVIAFIDMEHQIIPDEITVPAITSLPLVAIIIPEIHREPERVVFAGVTEAQRFLAGITGRPFLPPDPLGGAVFAAVIGLLSAFLGGWLYRRHVRRVAEGRVRRRDLVPGPVFAGVIGAAVGYAVRNPSFLVSPRGYSLASALVGMLVGAGLIGIFRVVGRWVFRKEAMGFGDVKLMGLLGGFLGWSGTLGAIFIACVVGSVIGIGMWARTGQRRMAFGPFLALGAMAVILFRGPFDEVLDWYVRVLGR